MSTAIDTAREALLSELEPLKQAYEQTKTQLEAIELSKKQLEAALKALQNGRGRSKASRGAPKPCARKSDVHDVCKAIVAENPNIPKADLEELAKEKLSLELGFNLSGFGLRFREVLSSGTFIVDEAECVAIANRGDDQSHVGVAVSA